MNNIQFQTTEEAFETLRLATESTSIGVWHWDLINNTLHCSEKTRSMFEGHDLEANPPHGFLDAVHPDDRERVLSTLQQAIHTPEAGLYECEYRITGPTGQIRFLGAKGRVFLHEPNAPIPASRLVGTVVDHTEKKLAEAALIHAEHMAMTGRLAASIAHEINNPLEAVTNLLYLLRGHIADDEGRQQLSLAESELSRVGQIVSQTLRFYRDPQGITDVDLCELIRSVVTLFHGKLLIRGIALELEAEQSPTVRASQGELRQVLVNVIGNAIDAMPVGGRLRVRGRTFTKDRSNQRIGVRLSIGDTGIGMNPEVLARIFEPFYTTKGSTGTGLGLWVSHSILEKYGFSMIVKSKPGKGTVFSVFMPLRTV